MSSSLPSNINPTLAKFVDKLITCIPTATGAARAAAPNALTGRSGEAIPTTEQSDEVEVFFRINPGGTSAYCKVRPLNSPAQAIEGAVDISALSGILA